MLMPELAEAAKQAKKLGARSISTICVHGLFVEDAITKLKRAGVNKIISTNTIQHPTNRIDVSPILIQALK